MRIWVVTGPIGAGKSAVSALLALRGAAVVDADLLGHEVLKDPVIIHSLTDEFGPGCLKNGVIDRKSLGAMVFGNDQAMARLNALTHPALLDLAASRLDKLAKEGNHELAVLEAAVYFLWPPLEMVDMVVSVVADDEIRVRRLVENRGMTAQQVSGRMKTQENLERFWNTADAVIDNSSTAQDLSEAVDQLLLDHNL